MKSLYHLFIMLIQLRRLPKHCLRTLIIHCAIFSTPLTFASELPAIGNSSSNLVSIQQERALGDAWLRSLRRHVDTYDNAVVQDYLSQLVYSLAPNSDVADRDFRLVIVDSPALNAFAVPGSIIGINAGLFFHAVSEQEFASVIAHELAHLSQRHYARRLEKQQLSTPLTLAGILASVVIAATAGSEAGMATLATTQAVGVDQQLKFSRQNEQEADRLAIETLYSSGYDPRAMPSMFERMYRQTRIQGSARPEYLSTHPLSETRIADTQNRASQYQRQNYRDSIEYHICKSMVVFDYAESEKSAINYFTSLIEKGNTTQIDGARFGLAYAQRQSDPESAIASLQNLLKKYPNQISIQIALAESHMKRGDTITATESLETLLKRTPQNYPISLSLANMYMETNRLVEARDLLRSLSRSRPEEPRVWYMLAEVLGLTGDIADLHRARAEFYLLKNRLDESLSQLKLAKEKSDSNQRTALISRRIEEVQEIKENSPF